MAARKSITFSFFPFMARIKLTPEIEAGILEHVRKHGTLDGATAGMSLTDRAVRNYLDKAHRSFQPAFQAKVKEAFAFYAKTHRHPSSTHPKDREILSSCVTARV